MTRRNACARVSVLSPEPGQVWERNMRRVAWMSWVVTALLVPGAASAKRPDPVPESQLLPCVELMRERLLGLAANNEAQVASELHDAVSRGETRQSAVAIASRRGTDGTELVLVSYQPLALGMTGTFGTSRPSPVSLTGLGRGYAIATVKAPLEDVEAERKKSRVVWLDSAPDPAPGDASTYPPVADNGTRMSRDATIGAVEAMNKQGGLPWLAWSNTTSRPVFKRVKVERVNDDAVEWLPTKNADSAMHPLFVFALDLENNGTPYLAIAYNDSPVSDRTEIWRPTKGKWKKVGEAGGNLATVRRTADASRIELVFDNYLDTTLVSVDVSGSARTTTECVANDGLLVNGGDGNITWSRMVVSEGARTVKAGAAPVPSLSFLSLDAPDGQVARGTRVWRLATLDDKALVAFGIRDTKSLATHHRPIANRVLEVTWIPSAELE